jgi:hypothetical protein
VLPRHDLCVCLSQHKGLTAVGPSRYYSECLFEVPPHPLRAIPTYKSARFPAQLLPRLFTHLLQRSPHFNMHHLDRFCMLNGLERNGWTQVCAPAAGCRSLLEVSAFLRSLTLSAHLCWHCRLMPWFLFAACSITLLMVAVL